VVEFTGETRLEQEGVFHYVDEEGDTIAIRVW